MGKLFHSATGRAFVVQCMLRRWNSRVLVLTFIRAGGHRSYAFMTLNGDPDSLDALLFACVTLLVPRTTCQPMTTPIHFQLTGVRLHAHLPTGGSSPSRSISYFSSYPSQVELVWKRRWGLGTILFVFNRYSPFIESIISLSSELGRRYPLVNPRLTYPVVRFFFLSPQVYAFPGFPSRTNYLHTCGRCARNSQLLLHVSTERSFAPDPRR